MHSEVVCLYSMCWLLLSTTRFPLYDTCFLPHRISVWYGVYQLLCMVQLLECFSAAAETCGLWPWSKTPFASRGCSSLSSYKRGTKCAQWASPQYRQVIYPQKRLWGSERDPDEKGRWLCLWMKVENEDNLIRWMLEKAYVVLLLDD